ncbi:hypothetical protein DF185_19085 [Marinifilum breve]|uniref:Uncharacterized protein n=1 Tax=Marinifilum breve TaxID=2184082 RepID=A0A2V3ZTE2_9BACT|nr:hypothetical protein [Marinifilum breve]PXX97125.1 hypothetical protein DF185_19085 [Marinifilum breve]
MISKSRFLIPLILCGLLAITTQSCFDSDDYDMDRLSEKVEWTPNMIAPVGYGTYTLWYLLNEHELDPNDQTIFLEGNNLVIRHRENDIFSYAVDEVLNFPNQVSQNLGIAIGNFPGIPHASIPVNPINFSETFSVNAGNPDIILSELLLNTDIDLRLTNPLNTEIDLTITFPGISEGGSVVTRTFRVGANANNQPESITLNNATVNFTTPYTTSNEIDIDFSVFIRDNGGNISGSGNVGVNLTVQNIDFITASGDFGKQAINIGTGSIDLDVDFWDDVDGEYRFADPKIHVHLRNSVGVPFAINANITGYSSGGNTQNLNPDVLQPVNYPKTIADVLDTPNEETITYDKTNSDIVDLMALPPSDRLDYFGNVNLNPNTVDVATQPNIISNTSRIDADIEIEIPLEFTATNLTLKDTIDDIDIDDADKVMNAAVVITAKNGYPLDVTVENIQLTDASYNVIDEIKDNEVIDAASVYTSGANIGVVDPNSIKEVSHEIKLTQAQIANLNKTENIIINAVVSTQNGGIPVKLKGDYELKFTISVQAQLDLSN